VKAPLFVLCLAMTAWGCRRDASPPTPRWSEAQLLAEGARYLDEATFRRSALESSLSNPSNIYSRQRLANYALTTEGWDLLPVWNPRSVVVTDEIARDARAGRPPSIPAGTRPLWDGKRPGTMAEWIALGREVFSRYPLRAEPIVEWGLAHPQTAERGGIRPAGDGTYPGLVAFLDVDGRSRIGISCGLCHADVEDGAVVVGQARRSFDYGTLRIAYQEDAGAKPDPTFVRRLHSWGPGRADVTEDDDEDPVAIPDLWGLREQTFLTQAGTIRHDGPTALAIRQETQLLTSNHQRVRPPRELAFALAMALYALAPPPRTEPAVDSDESRAGGALFARHCRRCHSNAVGGGDAVPVDRVGTDPALANGTARGTGRYRPPALVRVGAAGPYFHDGSVARLEDVLAPQRLLPTFTGGFLGPGPVKGHPYGTTLPKPDRAALVAYLQTL
jgi:mono/diheme cytochrome c family protein